MSFFPVDSDVTAWKFWRSDVCPWWELLVSAAPSALSCSAVGRTVMPGSVLDSPFFSGVRAVEKPPVDDVRETIWSSVLGMVADASECLVSSSVSGPFCLRPVRPGAAIRGLSRSLEGRRDSGRARTARCAGSGRSARSVILVTEWAAVRTSADCINFSRRASVPSA